MSDQNEFPGMPDFLGEAFVWCLGAVLSFAIVFVPLVMIWEASKGRRWLRVTIYIVASTVAMIAALLTLAFAALVQA